MQANWIDNDGIPYDENDPYFTPDIDPYYWHVDSWSMLGAEMIGTTISSSGGENFSIIMADADDNHDGTSADEVLVASSTANAMDGRVFRIPCHGVSLNIQHVV